MLDMVDDSKGTLLLVDDEVNIINSLKRIFVPLNYRVLSATTGQEALDLLETDDEIDIIISDMRMPEMDGATFLKKAADKWPEINRLLLTGYADINSAIAAINNGQIDYYLHKPWQPHELEHIIENLMEQRKLKESNRLLQIELAERNKELLFLNNHLEELVEERTLKLDKAYKAINHSYASVIEILSSLSEQPKSIFKGYTHRVAKLAQLFAEKLGLNAQEIQTIHTAGLLHIIGKIGMPESIITKPYQSLSAREKEEYEKYPLLGSAMLLGFPALEKVAHLIATHRELSNGLGYPHQFKSNDIPLESRILSIVVDYNELQSGLLFPHKLLASEALQLIKNNEEKRYDDDLAHLFVNIIKGLPQESPLNEQLLPAKLLQPGMVLSRDLITESGLKLLSRGYVLTQLTILTIRQIGNISVYVVAEST